MSTYVFLEKQGPTFSVYVEMNTGEMEDPADEREEARQWERDSNAVLSRFRDSLAPEIERLGKLLRLPLRAYDAALPEVSEERVDSKAFSKFLEQGDRACRYTLRFHKLAALESLAESAGSPGFDLMMVRMAFSRLPERPVLAKLKAALQAYIEEGRRP